LVYDLIVGHTTVSVTNCSNVQVGDHNVSSLQENAERSTSSGEEESSLVGQCYLIVILFFYSFKNTLQDSGC